MRLLDLPTVLRGAGLTVNEYTGWRTRGNADYGPPRGIICHHTGGSRSATDAAELAVLVNGSNTAPPPIAQLFLSRSGQWYTVASGLCYHALIGYAGPNEGLGNHDLIGIEAAHSGTEAWTARQYDSYVTGVAALCKAYNIAPSRAAGHKEHQPGQKVDPSFPMPKFRTQVSATARLLGEDMPLNAKDLAAIRRAVLGAEVGTGTGTTVLEALDETLTTVRSVDKKVDRLLVGKPS